MQVHVSELSGVTSISAEVDNSILKYSRLFFKMSRILLQNSMFHLLFLTVFSVNIQQIYLIKYI